MTVQQQEDSKNASQTTGLTCRPKTRKREAAKGEQLTPEAAEINVVTKDWLSGNFYILLSPLT